MRRTVSASDTQPPVNEDNTTGAAAEGGGAGQPEPAPVAGLEPAPADTGWIQQVSVRASRGGQGVVRFKADQPQAEQ
jgi:hypothetical protein